MTQEHDRDPEIESLRDRLSRLSAASLRINDSLDFDHVLQGVLESARSLTGANFSIIVMFDDQLQIEDWLITGLTPEQTRGLLGLPDGIRFFEQTSEIEHPVRQGDFQSYVKSLGLPEFDLPMPVSDPLPFMFASMRYRGRPIGTIYLGDREAGDEFTVQDEEALVMFASQAALVLANARFHRDEQRARADLEALVNTAPVGVLVFDARSGVPVSYNREVMRIGIKLAGPDVSIDEIFSLLTWRRGDGRAFSLQELPLATALSNGETVRAEEIELSVPGSPSITALINATPIRSSSGEMESFVVTVQDLSSLEEMEHLRAEFLGMVSHELRAPLSSIRGSATTLVEDEAELHPSEVRQFHRIILDQTQHMRRLITDLLDVARIEAGSLSVSAAPVSVSALVDEAKSMYLSSSGDDVIRIELPPDLPLVMADQRRLVQVIGNLLSNAARNSPASSLIRLTAELQDVYVAISVIDQGRGIPYERLPHLFRKFSRGNEDNEDTGLGLAICRGIIEAHGGRIWAESDGLDEGARFTFTLPTVQDTPTPSTLSADRKIRRERQNHGRSHRILIVDDDPQTLRYVRDVLSKASYLPIVTADPEDVPTLMVEQQPHLILLDLRLPDVDGIDLMQDLRKIAPVPIIFLSAYGQDEVIARAFQMGASDYVVKPFSPTELVARIQAALRRDHSALDDDLLPEPYSFGDLSIDHIQRRVTIAGEPIELTDTEYRVLRELAANPGRVLTHEQLVHRVWGPYKSTKSGAVRAVVKRLRRKLSDDAEDPQYVITRRGVGYWMPRQHDESEPSPDSPPAVSFSSE
ncbi:MAG: response regulator [Chloroflexi bacterium]|nr:response regulator [Chloroflexota bacterium]